MQNPNLPGVSFPNYKPKRPGVLPGEHLPRTEILEHDDLLHSLDQKIENRLNGVNTEDLSQLRFGAQELIHSIRSGIASRMSKNNPQAQRVYERANRAILDRDRLSGEAFQVIGEPNRPSNRRQQRKVRKISKSIYKSRALHADLSHLRESYGESIGKRQLSWKFGRNGFRRKELPGDSTINERINLRRAHHIARRTFKEIVKEERRRERILGIKR